MRTKYTYLIALAFLGTLLAVMLQESNLSHVKKNHAHREAYGRILTADDASYLEPPINWVTKGTWKDGSRGNSSFVQRPPGYGILFLVGNFCFPSNPYFFLKWIQIIGCFFSIIIVFKLLILFELSRKWAYLGTAIFAFSPIFSSFLYHVITEGISPFLLLWSFYEWVLILRSKGNVYRWIGTNAFLILVRPQLLILILLFMGYLLVKKQFKLALISSIILIPFALWMLRTYIHTGSFSLHPIYSENNYSYYRSPHHRMGELFKIWEFKSDRFHETMSLLQENESKENLDKAIGNVPLSYQNKVIDILSDYQQICSYQRKAMAQNDFSKLIKKERYFSKKVMNLQDGLIRSNLMDAYVYNPFNSASELFINSHLHLTLFQTKYRGDFWMEALRWTSLLLVLCSIITVFIISFLSKNVPIELWLICMGSVITILYLIFEQRLNEERYLTPILPIAFIAFIWFINALMKMSKNKNT